MTTLNTGTGWFSPESFQIYVSGPRLPDNLQDLTQSQKQVLVHELLHFQHFTTTTLGISYIASHFRELQAICNWKLVVESESKKHATLKESYSAVIKSQKYKSRLVVPSYYYEKGAQFSTIAEPERWQTVTSVATFMGADWRQSEHNFVLHRFNIDNFTEHNKVLRMSIGTKVLFEHLIRFFDILTDIEVRGAESLEDNLYASYEGQLLDYSALALKCATKGVKGINAFILSAIISHITLMLPIRWNNKINGIKKYAEEMVRTTFGDKRTQNYAFRSNHPSVSSFAILEKANELGAADIDFMSFLLEKENGFPSLNSYIEDLCMSFGFSSSILFECAKKEVEEMKRMELHPVLLPLKTKLLDEMESGLTNKGRNFAAHILSPGASKYSPVIHGDFHRTFIGTLMSEDEMQMINQLIQFRDELLKYPYERNVIE